MAYLSRILIYPVKSLDLVSVSEVVVLPSGALADDRRFAIVDGIGQYVNGKKNPRVHLLRSSFDPLTDNLTISGPGDIDRRIFHVHLERSALEQWLSNFFEFAVTFRENSDAGFPDDTESPGPTLISTATLREVSEWFGFTLDQARARFRANLEIDGVPPFWEDQLFGPRGTTVRFTVGGVVFDGINPCQRCVVPARDQVTGRNIPDFAKRFVEMRRKYFPQWAESTRFNHFYRLAINTRLADSRTPLSLIIGDHVKIIGLIGSQSDGVVAAAPNKRPARWSGSLCIDGISPNTPTVSTFRLTAEGGTLPFTYLPGQFLNVEVPIGGIVHRRCYTIASAPTQKNYCEITVKREEAGMVSRYLHDFARKGMFLAVSGPGGKFTFSEEDADSLLLIGAGVGITPLMSKIRYLADKMWPGEIRLLYCARTAEEIVFAEELRCLQKSIPSLKVAITLTRESDEKWCGLRGRITPLLLREMLPASTNRRIHICGPVEMADDITNMLREIGVAEEEIQSESFGGSRPAPSIVQGKNSNCAPCIGNATFADSGKSEAIHAGETILEIASSAGVAIDRGCLEGICGRCKVRLLSGEVTMEVDDALGGSDKQQGYVLACQAKPVGRVVIDA